MNRQISIRVLPFLALILTFSNAIIAQTPTPQPTLPPPVEDTDVIRVESRLVVVPVSVTDSNGQPVTGLKKEDFSVREESKTQQIEQVSDAEKVPLEIALLFDISASTDAMFKYEQETAAQFLREVMRPDDRATIFTVGAETKLIQSRETSEKSAIAVRSIIPTKEQTAFYEAVSAAANYLNKNTPPGRRKVILVISDGEDTNSQGVLNAIWDAERRFMDSIDNQKKAKTVEANVGNKQDGIIDKEELRKIRTNARNEAKIKEQVKVLRDLQNADAVFYSINPAGNSYHLNEASVFGQSNLQRFADETGGTAYLPKFQPIELKDQYQNSSNARQNQETLTKIFRQLANELQAQYLVQYYSETEFPTGKFVKLDVDLKNSRGLKLRARQGYFAKQ